MPAPKEIARAIGRASRIQHDYLNSGYGCAPVSIAFTHGDPDLVAQARLTGYEQIREIGQELAVRHGETMEVYGYNFDEALGLIPDILRDSKNAKHWILTVAEEGRGHLIGAITENGRTWLVDTASENHFDSDPDSLKTIISRTHTNKNCGVGLFRFTKKT